MKCNECIKRRCLRAGNADSCSACTYSGGNFLDVSDWLSDIGLPSGREPFDCVEVRFKNGRKGFYRNVNKLAVSAGDVVAVESTPGHDIGIVSLSGELARIQMRKKGEDPSSPEMKKLYRTATQKDIDTWQTAISREKKTLVRTREICQNLGLTMKLSDVEYQGDNLKATFFYTAEGRVDFRQLIKELAAAFGVRIEMRQIGLRQEAARVGSIGSCGRELCCTTWLTDFRSVNTSAARYQRLSLNPQKLAGQCGKLKCCLNFELDVYVDAMRDFPDTDAALLTEKGKAHFQKMDVFKGMYWYAYDFEFMNWIGLTVDAVRKIQQENKAGGKPESLEIFIREDVKPKSKRQEQSEMKSIEEEELTRFDKKRSTDKANRNSRRQNGGSRGSDSGDRKKEQQQASGQDARKQQQGKTSAQNSPQGQSPKRHDGNAKKDRDRQEERQRPVQDTQTGASDNARRDGQKRGGRSGRRGNRRGQGRNENGNNTAAAQGDE